MTTMEASRSWTRPSLRIGKSGTEYVVDVDVSGFALGDLSVEIEDHEVTVHRDRSKLDESFALPRDADVEWLTAVYEPGKLELHAPRVTTSTGKRRVQIGVRHRVLQNPEATPC
jgi:HSP20 family molecular chaperone IbpA